MSDRKIMVIKRETLFAQKCFDGFIPAKEFDFESIILDKLEWMDRALAERNNRYKQPIAYSLVYNPRLGKVFFYRRSEKEEDYDEGRLRKNWSAGVGGHIEEIDIGNGNPIHKSALREIQEEVEISGKTKMKVLGYINDDSNEVGEVHFCILYLVIIDSKKVNPKDSEMSEGKLVSIETIKKMLKSKDFPVENWTRIAIEAMDSSKGI